MHRALEQTEIFGALPERDLQELIARGTTVRFGARETIFQKGDPGSSMMVVLTGRVKITNCSADGKEAVLNFLEPNQVFGEISLLDGRPRTASCAIVRARSRMPQGPLFRSSGRPSAGRPRPPARP